MHSFIGLASVKQATIAVVAPGIAEALNRDCFWTYLRLFQLRLPTIGLVSQVEDIGNTDTLLLLKKYLSFFRDKNDSSYQSVLGQILHADINIVPYIDVMLSSSGYLYDDYSDY